VLCLDDLPGLVAGCVEDLKLASVTRKKLLACAAIVADESPLLHVLLGGYERFCFVVHIRCPIIFARVRERHLDLFQADQLMRRLSVLPRDIGAPGTIKPLDALSMALQNIIASRGCVLVKLLGDYRPAGLESRAPLADLQPRRQWWLLRPRLKLGLDLLGELSGALCGFVVLKVSLLQFVLAEMRIDLLDCNQLEGGRRTAALQLLAKGNAFGVVQIGRSEHRQR
jgi:hypothetical protein